MLTCVHFKIHSYASLLFASSFVAMLLGTKRKRKHIFQVKLRCVFSEPLFFSENWETLQIFTA